MSGPDDGFVARWSRRKRAAADADAAPPTAGDAAAVAAATGAGGADAEADADADALAGKSDAEILEALGLKDPDSLGPGDDFRAFLQAAVPEHLRRRALRRLWVSNPVLANLDGLNDYDGDYTSAGVAPGMLKTAYQIGKGIVQEFTQTADAPETVAAAPVSKEIDLPARDEESCEISDIGGASGKDAELRVETPVAARRKIRFDYG